MVTRSPISVGDNVRFTFGVTPLHGVVVENRGPIGVNGVRIFRVRVPNDPYDDDVFELPEDKLAQASVNADPIPREKVIEYLKFGGLLRILKSNLSGGKGQQRVWLGRDSLGNVVHTFNSERGIVGGEAIPLFVLRDNRIDKPQLEEVIQFLESFDLSRQDAEKVVKSIGIAS